MIKKQKIWSFILSLVLILSLTITFSLAGCKKAVPEEEAVEEAVEEEEEIAKEEEEIAKKDIRIVIWGLASTVDAWEHVFDDFESEFGYKVEFQRIPDVYDQNVMMKWAADERPDVLFFHPDMWDLAKLNPENNLRDLSSEDFIKSNSLKYHGKTYGASFNFPSAHGIIYNKEIFDDLNLEIPGNYEEFWELCKNIKAEGITPLYDAGGDAWPLQVLVFIWWTDAFKNTNIAEELNTNQTAWTDERILFGIQAQKDIQEAGFYNEDLLTGTYEKSRAALMDGRVAMVSQGSWMLDVLLQEYGIDEVNKKVGFFGISKDSDTTSKSTTIHGSLFLPKTGDPVREEAALELLRYISGERYQGYVNEIKMYPVLEGFEVPADLPEVKKEVGRCVESGYPVFSDLVVTQYGPMEIFLQEMLAGTKTPLEVAEALDREFTKSAQEKGIEGF